MESWASLVAQMVKKLPAMQETLVWSLGWEDSLEKEMATHSSILAWEIPWTEEPGGLQSTGRVAKFRHNLMTKPPPPWRTKEPKMNILTFLFYQASYRTQI